MSCTGRDYKQILLALIWPSVPSLLEWSCVMPPLNAHTRQPMQGGHGISWCALAADLRRMPVHIGDQHVQGQVMLIVLQHHVFQLFCVSAHTIRTAVSDTWQACQKSKEVGTPFGYVRVCPVTAVKGSKHGSWGNRYPACGPHVVAHGSLVVATVRKHHQVAVGLLRVEARGRLGCLNGIQHKLKCGSVVIQW